MIQFIRNAKPSSFLAAVILLCLLHSAPAMGQQGITPEKSPSVDAQEKMFPIPSPPLEALEEKVSKQLQERRSQFDAIVGDPATDDPTRSRAYGDLGLIYHAYELYEAAEACYRNALILDPDRYTWNYSLAYLLQKNGRFDDAIPFYQQALKHHGEPREAYLVNIRLGECFLGANNLEEAKKAFQKANTMSPDDPVSLARLGETAFKEKDYEAAVQFLESALEKQPAADKLHYTLAMAYRSLRKMKLAREHLAKRGKVGLQPPDPLIESLNDFVTGSRIHVLNARMAFGAERYEDAAELFRKAVEEDPEDAGCRVNLGVTLSKLGKHEDALAQFRKAVDLDPNNVTARFNLGSLLLFLNQPDEALGHLEFVVQNAPDDATAHLFLANALMKKDQFDESITHYRKATEIDGTLTDAWLELSTLYSRINQPQEAFQTLETAHEQLPKDGAIAHALARQLVSSPDYRQRDGKRALLLALTVYRVKPDFEAAKTVAMAYAELNQCDKAVTWMKTAIKIATNTGEDMTVIRTLFRNMEHLDKNQPCRIP